MRRNAVHLLNLVRNNDTDGCYKGDGEATNGNKACNGDGAANGGGDISARGGANDGAQNGKKTDNVVNPMMAMDTADNLDKQHTNEKWLLIRLNPTTDDIVKKYLNGIESHSRVSYHFSTLSNEYTKLKRDGLF